jgi:hypothetical protein
MFGSSISKVNYVECSTPDGNNQTQICVDKGIKSYPTWVFSDGSNLTGEVTLEKLSQKTGCLLPGATTTPTSASSTAEVNASSTILR